MEERVLREQKKHLRQEYICRRNAVSEAERHRANAQIAESTIRYLTRNITRANNAPVATEVRTETKTEVVALYRAYRGEADVWSCAPPLWQSGFRVAVPIVNAATNSMEFVIVDEHTEWQPGAYGILEPVIDSRVPCDNRVEPANLRFMVVPGVAFTRNGVRLGYGGGYYDRFFSAFRGSVTAIGVAFSCQMAAELPTGPHDVRMDVVITEGEVMECKPMPSF